MATETNTPGSRPARRTIVKGAAWAVPAVVVASAAPAMAASSVPPPPVFDFSNAYKNPGNSCTTSCVPKQSYGVPVTVANPSDEDFYIKFTSYTIGTKPVGVHSVVTNPATCAPVNTGCTVGTCGTTSTNSVCIPAGAGAVTFYVTSGDYGSSPNEGQAIGWEWIRKSDCMVERDGVTTSAVSPPGCTDSISEPSSVAEEPAAETETPIETVEEPTVEAPAIEEPAVEAPAVEETEPVEEQTVDTAEVTSAPDVSTDESTENN